VVLKIQDIMKMSLMSGFYIYGRKYFADLGANVQDKHIVIDKNIITSTGPATGLDVAFKLLEMLTSTKNVDEVKKYMRFTNK
jgi:4-methyl-5(b-hydroxyethyl)-thiazole monophosphate biosynthesis